MNMRMLIAGAALAAVAVPALGQSLLNQLIQQIGKKKATVPGGSSAAGGGSGRFQTTVPQD